jgi:hypothetical protein
VWNLGTYMGETGLDLMENADIIAHNDNITNGAKTWTFIIASSTSTPGGFICFKA